MNVHALTPNKRSFYVFPLWKSIIGRFLFCLLVSFLFGVIGTYMFADTQWWQTYFIPILVGIWILYIVFILYRAKSLKVRFEKTSWFFTQNTIMWKTGGIFSDAEVEVPIKNITHVAMIKPWLEFKFFGTGRLQIDSAGTSGTSLIISHIEKSDEWYDYVQKLMVSNGFSLKRKNLTQSSKPNILASFAKIVGGLVLFMIIVGFQMFLALIPLLLAVPFYGMLFLLAIVVFGIFPSAVGLYVQYRNLKATEYRVYDDCIEYNNGFLTTKDVIIPAENITDTHLDQQLFDRVFDIHNLKISCQGGGKEITFANIHHGKELKSAIDTLNAQFDPIRNKDTHFGDGLSTVAKKVTVVNRKISRDTTSAFTVPIVKKSMLFQSLIPISVFLICAFAIGLFVLLVTGRMGSIEDVLLSLFIGALTFAFPVIILFGVTVVSPIIRANTSFYTVGETTLAKKIDFISKQQQEFSTDRVTSVIVRESIIQRWLQTCSVYVYSIGSQTPIVFEHISTKMIDSIFSKVGIDRELNEKHVETPRWSIGMFLARLIPLFLGLIAISLLLYFAVFGTSNVDEVSSSILKSLFIFVCVLILITIVMLTHSSIYVRNARMVFTSEYICSHIGLLRKTTRYVLAQNVRDVVSTKIPYSLRGSIKLEVAGESALAQENQNNRRGSLSMISNNVTLSYVQDVEKLHTLIDTFLANTDKVPKVNKTTKPSYKPSLIVRSIVSVILFPLLVLYPFMIAHLILSTKATTYVFDSLKLTKTYGILFKSKKTVLLNKIDHVFKSQGAIQKMCGLGSVGVATTGTISVDISVQNVKDFSEWYADLKSLSED